MLNQLRDVFACLQNHDVKYVTRTPGIEFDDVWLRRNRVTYQKQEFYILSLADLITSKRAAGRPKDLEDIRALQASEDE